MAVFDLDHWREILSALSSNKLRTALTAFGVFWGIFMLMIMLGAGDGLHNGVMADFGDQATNSFFVWTQRTSKPYRGLNAGRSFDLTDEDTPAIKAQVDEVEIVTPRSQLRGYRGGNNVSHGTKAGNFQVMGDTPDYLQIERVRLERGRFLNWLDLEEKRKIAVIGTRVRDVLFGEGVDPIGDTVKVNGVYFKVVGVFKTNRPGEDSAQDAETLYVPFTTFQQAFNYGNQVGWYAITSRPDVPASIAEAKVIRLLKRRHRVAPDDERAFGSWNTEEEYQELQALFNGISALVWIVGIGTLAAGVIGVSNIMLVIVKERTNEIGIRRAIGASPMSIIGQVVFESVVLTATAGYFGLFLGFGVVDLVGFLMVRFGANVQMFANPSVSITSALQALAILVVAGVLAGLIPAQRAVRINTVEALRSL